MDTQPADEFHIRSTHVVDTLPRRRHERPEMDAADRRDTAFCFVPHDVPTSRSHNSNYMKFEIYIKLVISLLLLLPLAH
jgi:hypothetical protein